MKNRASDLRRRSHGTLDLVLGTPWLVRAVMALGAAPCRRFPAGMFERARALAPAVDQPMLGRPEMAAALSASLREAFRHGGQGVADELLLARP